MAERAEPGRPTYKCRSYTGMSPTAQGHSAVEGGGRGLQGAAGRKRRTIIKASKAPVAYMREFPAGTNVSASCWASREKS